MTQLAKDDKSAAIQALSIGSTQQVTYTGTADHTSAFSDEAVVRLYSTTDCRVVIGVGSTATATDMPLKAESPEYFRVPIGARVSVIRETEDGTLNVSTMI